MWSVKLENNKSVANVLHTFGGVFLDAFASFLESDDAKELEPRLLLTAAGIAAEAAVDDYEEDFYANCDDWEEKDYELHPCRRGSICRFPGNWNGEPWLEYISNSGKKYKLEVHDCGTFRFHFPLESSNAINIFRAAGEEDKAKAMEILYD